MQDPHIKFKGGQVDLADNLRNKQVVIFVFPQDGHDN